MTKGLFSKVLLASTVLVSTITLGNSALAGGSCSSDHGNGTKVTVCHATGSSTNPYVRISVSTIVIPRSANNLLTVDLPHPMPPVKPTTKVIAQNEPRYS